MLGLKCKPGVERVGDRAAHKAINPSIVETAVAKVKAALGLIRRLRGDVVDRAAGRVLSEQHALRPFQHFDTLEIQPYILGKDGKRKRNLVHVNTDIRIRGERCFVETHAAQGINRGIEQRGCVGEPRNHQRQVLHRMNVLILQCVA